MTLKHVFDLEEVGLQDIDKVGGKNASLGELLSALRPTGVRVPGGFATSAEAYRLFLADNGLLEPIGRLLGDYHAGTKSLDDAAAQIRQLIAKGVFPQDCEAVIRHAYRELCREAGEQEISVAVRSSATAEDLPQASFAGQQESFLNVCGEEALLEACRQCYASLYTARAVSYRETHGFRHEAVALSVGVQRMVRSDQACSGVMFTIDTESGFPGVVIINAAPGLGEMVVQGRVDPDEYQVFKPLLGMSVPGVPAHRPIIAKERGAKLAKMVFGRRPSEPTRQVRTSKAEREGFVLCDDEILLLSQWGMAIENHYGRAMDIEWAKDGSSGELFVVQARPETGQHDRGYSCRTYALSGQGPVITEGTAIGQAVATGTVCLIECAADIGKFVDGSILVTSTTDPDWVPIMKRAAAIVTDHGGRTSHAAIVSRELGLPAIVGTGNATHVLHDDQEITVSCAQGQRGTVYAGIAAVETQDSDLADLAKTDTQIMLNMADPAAALRWWRLPADGVGLVRMEFVIAHAIKVHPMALVRFDDITNCEARTAIEQLTREYANKEDYFVEQLSVGLGRIAALAWPRPVIVRMSDFKTNEYAELLGGRQFEPVEANPMLGFRGASRYYSPLYRDGFALECLAIRRLREQMGFSNVVVMIPFCRSVAEADKVLDVMAENGLRRGDKGLEVYVMCEIPSNVVQAASFAERFDGFSIGSNDLTQLTLGIDRDSELLVDQFDEQDDAVKWMIRHVISEAHQHNAKVGLCGQGPSDHPEFARFLVECGIDSISVSPDSFVAVRRHVAEAEANGQG